MIRNADQYSGGMASPDENRPDGLGVLRRAAAALDEIATAPGRLRLVDLESRLGWPKSTVRRLVVGLVEIGYAGVDEQGRYRLGDRLLGLTHADSAALSAAFRPLVDEIALATGETVDLSVLRGDQMWFIDQVESTHRLRAVSAVGTRFPLDCTANGKAALAVLAGSALQITFDRDEHTDGISAAGIAGRVAGGQVVAISVPAPSERFRAHEDVIVTALRTAAAAPKCPWYRDDTSQ